MKKNRIIQHVLATLAFLTVNTSTWAAPILFEFTGTVTDQVLSSGRSGSISLNRPEWNGKTITGTMSMDVEGLATNPNQSPEQVHYTSGDYGNPADWLSFSWINPDGSAYTIPGGFDPLPNYQVDGSSAYLTDSVLNGTQFYAGRAFSNLRPQSTQSFSLRLQARGPNDSLAISSMNFDTVAFLPEFANYENYGIVRYGHPDGTRLDYHFTINSITRVPEPSGLLLILCGLVGLFLAHRRHVK